MRRGPSRENNGKEISVEKRERGCARVKTVGNSAAGEILEEGEPVYVTDTVQSEAYPLED